MKSQAKRTYSIPAIKVRQWLPQWDQIKFDSKAKQSRPQGHFFICAIKASHLKALTGVYRRSTKGGMPRTKDPNVQRGHEEERSSEIREFVQFGFPWCEMGESKRKAPGAQDLLKPGWLPTSILINILPPDSERNGKKIPASDLMCIEERDNVTALRLPESFSGANWEPEVIFPLEVIDGQHRLWAFDNFDPGDDFELPVVAFYGLDRSWQAYLFWSVNITPQRINRSLAFDLYPLLRKEDWLDRFAGHAIYRETRCQELVETLWVTEESSWYQRINMLGEKKKKRERQVPMVTQAAWIRSLMATLVKQWGSGGSRIGGLFGAPSGDDEILLPWNRPMQAAFLIYAGVSLRDQIKNSKADWAKHLRKFKYPELIEEEDPAFFGDHSLLMTDQGIRGFLFILNDLCYLSADDLKLTEWNWEMVYSDKQGKKEVANAESSLSEALRAFRKQPAATFIDEIANGLSTYDWRTSSTPDLSETERLRQSVYRGSSGYKELRHQLLLHLSQKKGRVGVAANRVFNALGFTK